MIRVVAGHICSGKSTYVRENSKPGDVVIDMDRIALALSHEASADLSYGDHIRAVAKSARWAAIETAVQLHRRDAFGNRDASFNVWIIHTYPTAEDERMYWMWDATIVRMNAAADVLLSRAKTERPQRECDELRRRLDADPSAIQEGVGSVARLPPDGRQIGRAHV